MPRTTLHQKKWHSTSHGRDFQQPMPFVFPYGFLKTGAFASCCGILYSIQPDAIEWCLYWSWLFSARIALASRNRRVGRRSNSFMIALSCLLVVARDLPLSGRSSTVIGFITLNPLLHKRFRLFDIFSSGCIGHKWSLWMGTQEDRFKTLRVHRTHYDSRLLSQTIRALLNRLGNCAVVLWMYFH